MNNVVNEFAAINCVYELLKISKYENISQWFPDNEITLFIINTFFENFVLMISIFLNIWY